MAQSDASEVQHDDHSRIAFLERNQQHLSQRQLQRFQNGFSHPNLNLPQPPSFSEVATNLPGFKMKFFQFLHENPHTYTSSQTHLLYAGSLLTVSAGQWYRAHVDPLTIQLPTSYDLGLFFKELEGFFGGAVNVQSRERALRSLRQTRPVSDLVVASQNIAHIFSPL